MRRTEENGWSYEVLPLEASPDESDQIPDIQAFKDLWNSKRDGDKLPCWRDFELEDFAPWYGWIVVEDIVDDDLFNTRIRLWGTNVTELWCLELTGKLSRDFEGTVYSVEDFEMCATMVRDRQYRVCFGPLDWQHDFSRNPATRMATIQLPLADDGVTIDRLIELYVLMG